MATQSVTLSGGWRVSSLNPLLDLITKAFSGTVSCTNFVQQEYVIAANVSEFVVSIATVSSPSLIIATATNALRINFPLPSGVSAASAGIAVFKELYAVMASGGNLPSGLHFSNSNTDSSTLTLIMGQ